MRYLLALVDFVSDENNQPLLDLANIVKVAFPARSIQKQRELILKHKG